MWPWATFNSLLPSYFAFTWYRSISEILISCLYVCLSCDVSIKAHQIFMQWSHVRPRTRICRRTAETVIGSQSSRLDTLTQSRQWGKNALASSMLWFCGISDAKPNISVRKMSVKSFAKNSPCWRKGYTWHMELHRSGKSLGWCNLVGNNYRFVPEISESEEQVLATLSWLFDQLSDGAELPTYSFMVNHASRQTTCFCSLLPFVHFASNRQRTIGRRRTLHTGPFTYDVHAMFDPLSLVLCALLSRLLFVGDLSD